MENTFENKIDQLKKKVFSLPTPLFTVLAILVIVGWLVLTGAFFGGMISFTVTILILGLIGFFTIMAFRCGISWRRDKASFKRYLFRSSIAIILIAAGVTAVLFSVYLLLPLIVLVFLFYKFQGGRVRQNFLKL